MEEIKSLTHNGPLFLENRYKKYPKLDNIPLESTVHDMLYAYAEKMDTDYIKNSTFNKNFYNDLSSQLKKEKLSLDLAEPSNTIKIIKIAYNNIQKYKLEKSEIKEDKELKKKESEERKELYGYCILNKKKVALSSPAIVETSGIFIARGDNPLLGCWKYEVRPSDIIVNVIKDKEKTDYFKSLGYKVESNPNFKGIFKYKENIGNKTFKNKECRIGGILKEDSDKYKFEKAQYLAENWSAINKYIIDNVDNKDNKIRECAIISYLVMLTGIRIGTDKDEEISASSVGMCQMEKEKHLTLRDNDRIVYFDFLGKDSVRNVSQYKMNDKVYNQLVKIYNSKIKNQCLFSVSSTEVNKFLKDFDERISAKLFRTAYGCSLLAKELQSKDVSKENLVKKIDFFNNCNLAVAKKLNHKKTLSKEYMDKLKEQEKSLKLENESLKITIQNIKAEIEQNKKEITKLKTLGKTSKVNTLKEKNKKLKLKISTMEEKFEEKAIKFNTKKSVGDFALNTSKTNYSNPRVTVSWCKDMRVPLNKIFTKSLLTKFNWAEDTPKDFWRNYPVIEEY